MSDTEFETHEETEMAAEQEEAQYRRYTQRISNLEYGIDGALDMLDTLAERANDTDADLAASARRVHQFLTGYRHP
ncbi:hypothetical protein [Streptomyces sp. NPDC085596]|uniref:hypothetical protein n=1 Tax=Streptomyces sp. NPDC085596 TaxID=3365731 RepID=UPI0037D0A5C0